ncbi:helix-turn-helix domain-containing protein [Pedobacter polysacchareus]|uniref:helix-turn-helix domain-containing protein n=1 Tax=Pedobacter polysacchareus TaxID=2861973 RepID=UPI001C99A791|nr:AraC family transcriptional regulator [Pedobacter polysacchareus]
MQTVISNSYNPILKELIQCYIFFNHTNGHPIHYTTFPNTNLCLALYQNNRISYLKNATENRCILNKGVGKFSSRIYAFHQQPFQVDIRAEVDQICIIFHPGALTAFTKERYAALLEDDHPFERIFKEDSSVLVQLFAADNQAKRVAILEELLVKNIIRQRNEMTLGKLLRHIHSPLPQELQVEQLAKEMNINVSTLYRIFMAEVGQSPKKYLQTLRFRKALDAIKYSKKLDLTAIAYQHQFYDQAHFIKQFNSLSGETPGRLIHKISLEQQQLVWLYDASEYLTCQLQK